MSLLKAGKINLAFIGQQSNSMEKIYPYLLLLIVAVPALVLRLDVYPSIWFDEGYKMNAVRTLAERGIFGTYTTTGYIPFDPGISSGPADIAPLALSYLVLGQGVTQARLVIVLYTLLGLICFYNIANYLYGRAGGLFITLFMLAVPAIQEVSFLLVGRQILGEAPALALILLGLWLWFRSWDSERWGFEILAGLALGLGLLSKTQIAIALAPTICLITLGRIVASRSPVIKSVTPLAITVAVIAGWMLLGRLGTTDQIRQENSELLLDAIRSNLLTGLFGSTLTSSAMLILSLMIFGVIITGWRLRKHFRQMGSATNKIWAEITLALFGLGSAIWFGFLSVGWPRYAYAGLVVSLLLVGKFGWDIFQQVQQSFEQHHSHLGAQLYALAIASFMFISVVVNIHPVLRFEQDSKAQQMADFINAEVPREAVIETWEWELDALGNHWEYHHPHQRNLFLAIRQFSHEETPFNLNYDLLQADPDYLVTGPFSNWTGIYDANMIEQNFVKITEVGAYQLYKRID